MDREGQQQDAEVGGKPGELLQAPFGAHRPGRGDRGPHGESAQQGQRHPRDSGHAGTGQQGPRGADQHHPPDHDSDLVPDDDVVATALEREIQDQAEAQQPCGDCRRIDPLEHPGRGTGRMGGNETHRLCIRLSVGWADIGGWIRTGVPLRGPQMRL